MTLKVSESILSAHRARELALAEPISVECVANLMLREVTKVAKVVNDFQDTCEEATWTPSKTTCPERMVGIQYIILTTTCLGTLVRMKRMAMADS
jgi:hypothetical protein